MSATSETGSAYQSTPAASLTTYSYQGIVAARGTSLTVGMATESSTAEHADGEFRADPLTSLLLERHFNRGLPDKIRERAYELYLQRGEYDGHAMQDWLDAELEILSGR